MTVQLFLFVCAFALAAYSLFESRGRGVLNWAVALIALGLIWTSLPRF